MHSDEVQAWKRVQSEPISTDPGPVGRTTEASTNWRVSRFRSSMPSVRRSLVIGHAFFVLADLLLDLPNGQIECGEHGGGVRGGDKVRRMLCGNVDFHVWLVQVFQVNRHFDGVDPIEKAPQFLDLFDNDRLILGLEVAMASGNVDLHGESPWLLAVDEEQRLPGL